MEDKITACILDVTGVQSYIFSSNKLKENLGASFIVKNIYNQHLSCIIKEHFKLDKFDIDFWKSNIKKTDNSIFKNYKYIDICYIGGGNALLFFKDLKDFKNIIKKFTTHLLVHAPGLNLMSACIQTSEKEIKEEFNKVRKRLLKQLDFNKNLYTSNIFLSRHGFTASCPRTGLSVENLVIKDTKLLSSVSLAKINNAESSEFDDEFKDILEKIHKDSDFSKEKKSLEFTKEIEELGQQEGDDNFIAVVHIDGNEIGKLFKDRFKKSFISARRLSIDLAAQTKNAFSNLVKIIIKDDKKSLISKDNFTKKTLPIRPVIIGGDDITFVCPGKLGIYFAEEFIKFFVATTSELSEQPLSMCAGIGIAKTKYPFFRAYKIAQELCDNAKEKRKNVGDKGSWLDFHIIETAKTGTLEDVRKIYYEQSMKKLYTRPYFLDNLSNIEQNKPFFSNLKKNAGELSKLPRNKRMELSQVLFENKNEQKKFINHMKFRDYTLPQNATFFQENNKICFLDIIELLEFYPQEFLLEKNSKINQVAKENK